MKINFKAVNLELTGPLKEYIELKFEGLAKFVTQIENHGTEVLVQVEVGRTSNHHGKGDVYAVGVNVDAPQNIVRLIEEGSDVRAIVDVAHAKLKQMLVKYKERRGN